MSFPLFGAHEIETGAPITQEFWQKLKDRDDGRRSRLVHAKFQEITFGGPAAFTSFFTCRCPVWATSLVVQAEYHYTGGADSDPEVKLRITDGSTNVDSAFVFGVNDAAFDRLTFPEIALDSSFPGHELTLKATGQDSDGIGNRHHLRNDYSSSTHGFGLFWIGVSP